jgi:hypothetical protein
VKNYFEQINPPFKFQQMETSHITHFSPIAHQLSPGAFEDAYYNSRLRHSLRHLATIEEISEELVMEALQKALKACGMLGIKSDRHFKKVYVFDEIIGTLHADWMMSRNGFNLIVMQIPSLNARIAQWLWELAES